MWTSGQPTGGSFEFLGVGCNVPVLEGAERIFAESTENNMAVSYTTHILVMCQTSLYIILSIFKTFMQKGMSIANVEVGSKVDVQRDGK